MKIYSSYLYAHFMSVTLTAMLLTACDRKDEGQKLDEARAEAGKEIIAAQAEADQVRLSAELKITEARREAGERTGISDAPPPIILIPDSEETSPSQIVDHVRDALNVRPNEATKDRLENRAEEAREDAETAADAADEAAQRADRAAKAASGQ
jgi:hypothetical protein